MTTPQSYANYCEERKTITVFIVYFNIFHYFRTSKTLFGMKKILIVGAGGQIGSELIPYLRGIYGAVYFVFKTLYNSIYKRCKSEDSDKKK